jgi:hypothetical protein
MAGFHTRRTLEHWHPDDGPLDAWLATWAERGMAPEYPWPSTPITVNGRTAWPFALIDAEWLAAHPHWMSGLAPSRLVAARLPAGNARQGI